MKQVYLTHPCQVSAHSLRNVCDQKFKQCWLWCACTCVCVHASVFTPPEFQGVLWRWKKRWESFQKKLAGCCAQRLDQHRQTELWSAGRALAPSQVQCWRSGVASLRCLFHVRSLPTLTGYGFLSLPVQFLFVIKFYHLWCLSAKRPCN